MKKGALIISLFTVVIAFIFILDYNHDDQVLGNGYYFLPEYEAKDVGYPGGATIYKSTEKYSFDEVIIEGGITEVEFNEDFILVLQEKMLGQHELLDNYYIIIKNENKLLGPMKKQEYLIKIAQLNIPFDLN